MRFYRHFTKDINHDISIFCNNCVGAFVAHDFNLPFNSPTVNLMIPPTEFITYISNLKSFAGTTIVPVVSDKKWPVAILGGKVHLNLIHYKSVDEAVEAWRRREKRINWNPDKQYFILVETDGCTYEDLQAFDNLPYNHKVALTHKEYPEIKCHFVLKGYEKNCAVVNCHNFHKIIPTRRYDEFNWHSFLK